MLLFLAGILFQMKNLFPVYCTPNANDSTSSIVSICRNITGRDEMVVFLRNGEINCRN